MVIVFDKKTPAAAYNNRTASNRQVFLTVEMQLKFLKDNNLKSVEVKSECLKHILCLFSVDPLESLWQEKCGLLVRNITWSQGDLVTSLVHTKLL